VIALHTDSDGVLWIATERGVSRFATERFSPPLVRPGSFIQRVVNIASSDEGLWLRDFGLRVYRWTGGAVSPVEDLPDAYRTTAFAMFTDRDGRLWIGSGDGTIGVRQRTGEFRSYEPRVGRIVCFAQDADGGVWVGGDEGLTRFANDTLTTVAPQNGLLGGVKSIVEDEDGVMWVGAGTGIFRIEKGEIARVALDPLYRLRSQFFNGTDGVAGVPFAEGSGTAVRSKDGRLWFATSSGLTVIDPRRTGDRRASPTPLIEAVTADARAFDLSAPLRLPAGTAHLQIVFNALTLSDPLRVRFRYRLEGFDRDWIDAGASRQATYTNLPPRQYRFLVSVTTGDGTWSEPRAPLALTIAPMFYQTRWFAALCGFAVFALVYAAWRLRVRQVRRQFSLVLAERIRMSRAIHDTLLQGLAALALQVDDLSHHLDAPTPDSKRRVLGIRQQVEEYIRQARSSIWDLRSPILAARDLPRALRHTAELAVAGGPLELDMTVTGKPRGESAAVDEQLLLIAQEAVNNAVQHSRARHVAVALDYGDEAVHLRVSDDGCGFDPASTASGHYGLISMRERAEQVHGQLSIVSAPGAGTRVETIVPTP
jgi:signal transduction histidine kinase